MFSSASLTVAAPPVANTIAQRVLACTGCLYNFAPATVGSPRPFGMPPFATELSDDEVAQLLSFVRGS